MAKPFERIAVLTSGGDGPGMNAALEALVNRGLQEGMETLGCRGGFLGLEEGWLSPLEPAGIFDIHARGGTVLKTSRHSDWTGERGEEKIRGVLQQFGVDAVVALGGEGTICRGLPILKRWGVSVAAIPCTIDNDVPGTEETVGFDTACNRTLPLVEGIRDTAEALPGRAFVLETLGGGTGHIALRTAWINRADAVLVPEVGFSWEAVGARLRLGLEYKGWALLVAGEGVGGLSQKLPELEKEVGTRVRLTTLGHAQRGGPPSARDRWLARELAELTVERLAAGEAGFLAALRDGRPAAVPLEEVEGKTKPFDVALYNRINRIKE